MDDLYNYYGGSGFSLDLGCGYYKPPGFIGIDNLVGENSQIINEGNAPDILMDINNCVLPFADGSCNEVRASHFLEHSDVDHIINEVYRVLKPGGIFLFAVPYANSAEGMYPGHNIFFTEKWFLNNLNFQKKFYIMREEYLPSTDYISLPWYIRMVLPFNFSRKFLFNACSQMTLTCKTRIE